MGETASEARRATIAIAGAEIEYFERGEGEPLLYLHGGGGLGADGGFLDLVAKRRRVIAPAHPGFGKSSLPDWIDSVDDLAHIHLELMDRLGLSRVDVTGCSIGGWIASEIATKTPERIRKLALVGPVGVKTGAPDRLDIPDIFTMAPGELQKIMFHDPAKFQPDFSKMSDEALNIAARDRETLTLLVWEPYMHNPKLPHRLQRLNMPALFIRGASDGLVSADYLERYARLVAGARIATIAEAGHAPQIEQPAALARTVLDFLGA